MLCDFLNSGCLLGLGAGGDLEGDGSEVVTVIDGDVLGESSAVDSSVNTGLEAVDFDADNWLLVLGHVLLSSVWVVLRLEVSVGTAEVREGGRVAIFRLDFFRFASDVDGVLFHSGCERGGGEAFILSWCEVADGLPVDDLVESDPDAGRDGVVAVRSLAAFAEGSEREGLVSVETVVLFLDSVEHIDVDPSVGLVGVVVLNGYDTVSP